MSRHSLALARVQAQGTGQGVRIFADLEAQREREQELERALKGQKRERKAQSQSSKGRFFGGLGGSLLGALLGPVLAPFTGGLSLAIPALLAGAGSFAGQKFATGSGGGVFGVTAGDVGLGRKAAARDKLRSIDVGSFQRSRGRERETEFRAGEQAFLGDLESLVSGAAIQDFKSAFVLQNLLPALFGGSTEVPISQGGGSTFQNLASLSDIDRRGLLAMINSISQA